MGKKNKALKIKEQDLTSIIDSLLDLDSKYINNRFCYFKNKHELAFRNEVIRMMFDGLNKTNQDQIIIFLLCKLVEQNLIFDN